MDFQTVCNKTDHNMTKINTFFLLMALLVSTYSVAQNATISGFIRDFETGEALIGATIYEQHTETGTIANEYGFFSLTLPQDSVHLRVSFIGFQTVDYILVLDSNIQINITLTEGTQLNTVYVTAHEPIEQQSQMSAIHLDMSKVKALPVILGEQDIIKTLQLFPGIQSGSEGSSGLYVRGGGPDQNLILLDGVPIYNASHLFGFFSIFNADAINSATIIKGGFPARYGGRLSSVLDIRMKEGNLKKFGGEASIGLLSSKLTLEGPLWKDKTSFIISGRRTYVDVLAKPFLKAMNKKQGMDGGSTNSQSTGGYYFWDFNAKVNHVFSPTSRLYASIYMGKDRFYNTTSNSYVDGNKQNENKTTNDLKWGNLISALRWNKVYGPKLFMNVTGSFSRYNFNIGSDHSSSITTGDSTQSNGSTSKFNSGIMDWSGKVDFQYLPNVNHAIRFGIGNTYHTFNPGGTQQQYTLSNKASIDTTYGSNTLYSHEHWMYVEDDWKIGNRLKFNAGLHFSGFVTGDTWYNSLQPRLSGRYLITKTSAIKASYSRMTQYLHLLSNPTIGLPTDLWVPATERIKPEHSHQVALGYSKTLKKGFQFSVEGYYKVMQNLIEYKEGASYSSTSQDWQDLVVVGKGNSYGAEFLLEKKTGKTTGWIGYTLSWSNRQFEDLNFGDAYPHRYDRRHDIGLAVTHKLNDKIDVGLVWVYGTGNATTLAQQTYQGMNGLQGGSAPHMNSIDYLSERNNYRMPAYHRLDLGVNLHKQRERFESTWSFGLYNAYSRQNPFYLYFQTDLDNMQIGMNTKESKRLYQLSLFPILPSISYKIDF